METIHPRDRTYTQQEKLSVVCNYIRNGHLNMLEAYAIGLDSWRYPLQGTDQAIRERVVETLLDMMPKQAQ